MKLFLFLFVSAFLIIGLSEPGMVENTVSREGDSPQNHDLKILTWNIYMLPYCSLINKNHQRAKIIAQKIRHSAYDILIFQEAFDRRSRKIIRNELSHIYPFVYGPANESFLTVRTNSGIWVLSKIPLNKLEEIEFDHRWGIDAMARKGAVLFEGNWNGNPIQLLGTHLQADSPDKIRREQCLEIADRLLKKHKNNSVPQLICGDFNIENEDSLNYDFMLSALNAKNGALEGVIQTSYDELDNNLAKCPNGKKRIIDYILISNAENVGNIRRKVSVLKEVRENEIIDLSDHYGIEASVSFVPSVISQNLNIAE